MLTYETDDDSRHGLKHITNTPMEKQPTVPKKPTSSHETDSTFKEKVLFVMFVMRREVFIYYFNMYFSTGYNFLFFTKYTLV